MTELIVATGATKWDSEFAAVLSHPMMGLGSVNRCLNATDIIKKFNPQSTSSVVFTDGVKNMDNAQIARLVAVGCPLIAVSDDTKRWRDLGVSTLIELFGESPVAVAKRVRAALQDSHMNSVNVSVARGYGIAVAGFGGGAGRSSCVRELAYALTQVDSDRQVLMADADTFGASLAQELGDLSTTHNLLTICRSFETGQLNPASWSNHVTEVHRNLSLLSGIVQSSRWTDLRAPALTGVWNACLEQFDVMVADTGPAFEVDVVLDSAAVRRNSARNTAVSACESVILCARADAVGVTRLVRGYLDSGTMFDDKYVSVVISGALSHSQSKDIQQAITRHTGLSQVYFVPSMPEVFHQALSHNTFAGLIEQRILQVFTAIATDVATNIPERIAVSGMDAVTAYLRPQVA